jgi:aminoglycoside 6'-N-acetyltransferase
MKHFRYKPLSFKDLNLLHHWYNTAHVLKWYSRESLDYAQLENKYRPYISGEKAIKGFICYFNQKPFGYIQYYPVKRYPWNGHDLGKELSYAAGLDVFIGETSFLGKGLGKLMINRFIQKHVFRKYKHCLVDPHQRNAQAIRCYEGCGFSIHKEVVSEEREKHYLMIKSSLA